MTCQIVFPSYMGNGARIKQIRDVHSDAISATKKMEELDATFKSTIISHLRIRYREFTYCDDDWKVYSFIGNFYSNWHRNLKDKEKRAERKRAQALEASQSVEEMSARVQGRQIETATWCRQEWVGWWPLYLESQA